MPVPETYRPSDTKPESANIRADDFELDFKFRVQIKDVELVTVKDFTTQKDRRFLRLLFHGKEKGMILRPVNQQAMEQRLGKMPNDWIGAYIVVWRTTAQVGSETKAALRIIEAKRTAPPQKPAPKPKPVEEYDVDPPDEGHAAQFDSDDTPF